MNLDPLLEVIEASLVTPASPGVRAWLSKARAMLLAGPQCFVFETPPAPAHCEFAVQLQQHGLFRLPFPTCLYSYPAETSSGPSRAFLLIREDGSVDRTWEVTAIYRKVEAGREIQMIGAAFTVHEGARAEADDTPSMACATLLSTAPPGLTGGARAAFARNRISHEASTMLGLTASLMSREFSQTRIEPSAKLNKARAGRGKPPILEHVLVGLRNYSGSDRDDGSSGQRRSPRLHWRRGHIRSLGDGRLIPIPPTIVGAGEEAFMRDYVVRVRER